MSRRCFAQRSVHLAGPSSVAQSPLSVPRPWRAGSKSSPSPNSPVIYYSSEASCEWIELAYKNFILSVPRSFLLAWLRLMSITADLSAVCAVNDSFGEICTDKLKSAGRRENPPLSARATASFSLASEKDGQ